MALISCEECGREVSDKAAACVGCGAPISGANGNGSAQGVLRNDSVSPATSKFVCPSCSLTDRTQVFKSVVAEELQFSSTDSTISLSAISNTVRHGRFQQALGTRWITGTRKFRRGSITSTEVSGTMTTEGIAISGRVKNWMDLIPPSDLSPEAEEGFKTLEDELFCARCDLFRSSEGSGARDINEAIAGAFGDYLHTFSEISQYKEMILGFFGEYPCHWLVKGELPVPDGRNSAFETALRNLDSALPMTVEPLIQFQSDNLESQVAFLSFGDRGRWLMGGSLLAKEYLPGEAVLVSSRSPAHPENNKLQLVGGFYDPGQAHGKFKGSRMYKKTITGRRNSVETATGIPLALT